MEFLFKPFIFTSELAEEATEVIIDAGDMPWPMDAVLCSLPMATQATVYEYAECIAVQAFLRMHGLKFTIDECSNAETMSISGKLPLLKVENHFVAGFDAIAQYARLRIRRQLNDEQESAIRPYVEMIQITVKNAELYSSWIQQQNYDQITKQRYGSPYKAPLRSLLPFLRRLQIRAFLREHSPIRSMDDVRESLSSDLKALGERLGPRPYFLDDVNTNELDALAFGHLVALLSVNLPEGNLAELVQRHQNLVTFCQRIDRMFFSKEVGINTSIYNTTIVTGMRRLPQMVLKSDS